MYCKSEGAFPSALSEVRHLRQVIREIMDVFFSVCSTQSETEDEGHK